MALLSGSASGLRPESKIPPSGFQPTGKVRLRSTPSAFWRVRAARPSGLTVSINQSAAPFGTIAPRSERVTAIPAGSSPWTHPITRIRRLARGSPSTRATIGRPSTERPIVTR